MPVFGTMRAAIGSPRRQPGRFQIARQVYPVGVLATSGTRFPRSNPTEASQKKFMNRLSDPLLGYINFSSGAHDPSVFRSLNELFREVIEAGPSGDNDAIIANRVGRRMHLRLDELKDTQKAFSDSRQAEAVLSLCFEHILPGWKAFHPDLLFHQDDNFLLNPFFIGRVFEQIMRNDPLDADPQELVPLVMRKLSDFIGHRPVAVLEDRRMEPYIHEYVRPVPVYVRDCGAAVGPYEEIVDEAIRILRECDEDVARAAQFDINRLVELAIDPRALDFDHPLNRRPNHHFGQWDEQTVDNEGYFNRFIIHQITIDSMLARVHTEQNVPRAELMYEAGAVLACTMLMGSGISGRGPGAWDSTMTLGQLVPMIASYRDHFYESLLRTMPEKHRDRLLAEASVRHQPFGAARQHINGQLGRHRDRQMVHSRLTAVYARMGYEEAALQQADVVQVASTRINTQLDCLLSSASVALRNQQLETAIELLPRLFELIRRGIECGALPDPWSIIAFDGNYALFPATENTVRDHRVDDLVELMNQVFQFCAQVWADSAAANRQDLAGKVQAHFREISDWWRKFAAHEVMSFDGVDPEDVYNASRMVAEALTLWHRGGAAAGDIEFWAQHAMLFESPSAYALVISALLERKDFKTSRALLVHWLSQSDRIELDTGDHAFHDLLWQWLTLQRDMAADPDPDVSGDTWVRIGKLHDYLEANADEYWKVPDFQPEFMAILDGEMDDWEEGDEEGNGFDEGQEDSTDDVLGAAYEGVVYHDQTDDGFEGEVHEGGNGPDDTDLEAEILRVNERLDFLVSLAGYWRIAATFQVPSASDIAIRDADSPLRKTVEKRREIYEAWMKQALVNRDQLSRLLDSVHGFSLSSGGVDTEAMQSYDRQRLMKESLVQQIIAASVEVENAIRFLAASTLAINVVLNRSQIDEVDPQLKQWQPVISVYAALLIRNPRRIVDLFPALNETLQQQSLLYVPLSRGGHPQDIVRFRATQSAIRELLASLPGLGLLVETFELTETAMRMERNIPADQGAVTEFDEIFRVAYCAMVETLIRASRDQAPLRKSKTRQTKRDRQLFQCLEDLTESMLIMWLEHSRTLRLSVLENVPDRSRWQPLVTFIKRYGDDLFTQEFLNLSNVRAILHQGVDQWLYRLQSAEHAESIRLLREIGTKIPFRQAVDYLTLILESIIENYSRYRDYNATTTQSDRGSLLHILLDFLRLERRYDRVGWHLKPVVWAHQMLVKNDENIVARDWRRSLVERVGPETDKYLAMLERLREKYSVQMASIGQHLGERFVQPMMIDRLVTLVGKAMKTPGEGESKRAFEMLQSECQSFVENSSGVGVDVPAWLTAMTEEVENQQILARVPEMATMETPLVDPLSMDLERLVEQIEMFPRRQLQIPGAPETESPGDDDKA